MNIGKGFALSLGVDQSVGSLVTFIDADMELDPANIGGFIRLMQKTNCDAVIGSKRHPMSKVAYPRLRRLQSWAYQMLVRILFNLNVRDTQTGLKLFKRPVLQEVMPLLAIKKFAFDLELLVVARQLGDAGHRVVRHLAAERRGQVLPIPADDRRCPDVGQRRHGGHVASQRDERGGASGACSFRREENPRCLAGEDAT